jgi:hypothetical protein
MANVCFPNSRDAVLVAHHWAWMDPTPARYECVSPIHPRWSPVINAFDHFGLVKGRGIFARSFYRVARELGLLFCHVLFVSRVVRRAEAQFGMLARYVSHTDLVYAGSSSKESRRRRFRCEHGQFCSLIVFCILAQLSLWPQTYFSVCGQQRVCFLAAVMTVLVEQTGGNNNTFSQAPVACRLCEEHDFVMFVVFLVWC